MLQLVPTDQNYDVVAAWRGVVAYAELNMWHAGCFGQSMKAQDWEHQLDGLSLGWVSARRAGRLIGFVNIA
jgi:hypothetical protein